MITPGDAERDGSIFNRPDIWAKDIMKPDSVRLLAEKIVNLFTDEFPTPEYITAKIESLLRDAWEPHNGDCTGEAHSCLRCRQARSAAFKEAAEIAKALEWQVDDRDDCLEIYYKLIEMADSNKC